MSGVERGSSNPEKRKRGVLETFKLIDKVGMAGGVGVYLLFGIPAALVLAGYSAISYGLTEVGEKGVKNFQIKLKGKNK